MHENVAFVEQKQAEGNESNESVEAPHQVLRYLFLMLSLPRLLRTISAERQQYTTVGPCELDMYVHRIAPASLPIQVGECTALSQYPR